MVDAAAAGVPGLGTVRLLRHKCVLPPLLVSTANIGTGCLPQRWRDNHMASIAVLWMEHTPSFSRPLDTTSFTVRIQLV